MLIGNQTIAMLLYFELSFYDHRYISVSGLYFSIQMSNVAKIIDPVIHGIDLKAFQQQFHTTVPIDTPFTVCEGVDAGTTHTCTGVNPGMDTNDSKSIASSDSGIQGEENQHASEPTTKGMTQQGMREN